MVLWKHTVKHHYIIQICPALERWILCICENEQINIQEFGLQNDLEALKNITKRMTSLQNEELKKLFRKVNSVNNRHVEKLKGWIGLLIEKNYELVDADFC